MSRSLWFAAVLGAATLVAACGDEGSIQGVRQPCASASGTLLGCDDTTIETPEDACWRLVECGVIPLEHDEDNIFDWANCVYQIERLSEPRYDFALQCVETSSCDDLKVGNSPVDPRIWDQSIPLCLQFGDRQ